jgi:hypothetical protein
MNDERGKSSNLLNSRGKGKHFIFPKSNKGIFRSWMIPSLLEKSGLMTKEVKSYLVDSGDSWVNNERSQSSDLSDSR